MVLRGDGPGWSRWSRRLKVLGPVITAVGAVVAATLRLFAALLSR
jgi:hypothetical protein